MHFQDLNQRRDLSSTHSNNSTCIRSTTDLGNFVAQAGQAYVLTELRKSLKYCPQDPAWPSPEEQELIYGLLASKQSPTHSMGLLKQIKEQHGDFDKILKTEVAMRRTVVALSRVQLDLPQNGLSHCTPLIDLLPHLQADVKLLLKVELDSLRRIIESREVESLLDLLVHTGVLSSEDHGDWRQRHNKIASARLTNHEKILGKSDVIVIMDAIAQRDKGLNAISQQSWNGIIASCASNLLLDRVSIPEGNAIFSQAFRELSRFEADTQISSKDPMLMQTPRIGALIEGLALMVELGIRSGLDIAKVHVLKAARLARRLAEQPPGVQRKDLFEGLSATIRNREDPEAPGLTPFEFYRPRGRLSLSSRNNSELVAEQSIPKTQSIFKTQGIPKTVCLTLMRLRQSMLYLGIDLCFENVVNPQRQDFLFRVYSRESLPSNIPRKVLIQDGNQMGVAV